MLKLVTKYTYVAIDIWQLAHAKSVRVCVCEKEPFGGHTTPKIEH